MQLTDYKLLTTDKNEMIETLGQNEPYTGKEDNFQISVANCINLKFKDLLWFHVPNGGNRNAREGVKFKRMGVMPGVCDILILESNKKYNGLFVELKTKKNKLQPSQKKFIVKAQNKNYCCVVCYNLDTVIDTIKRYLNNEIIFS